MKPILIIAALILFALSLRADTGIIDVQTSATGATYVALASVGTTKVVHVLNLTGTDLEVRMAGTGATVTVKDGTGLSFKVSSAPTLSLRRVDQSNTQVTADILYEN